MNEHCPHPVGPLSLEATEAPFLVSSERAVLPVQVDPGMMHVPALKTVKDGIITIQSMYFFEGVKLNGVQVVEPGGEGNGGGGRGGGNGGGAWLNMA